MYPSFFFWNITVLWSKSTQIVITRKYWNLWNGQILQTFSWSGWKDPIKVLFLCEFKWNILLYLYHRHLLLISDNFYVFVPEPFLFLYFKYWYFCSLKRFWDCDFKFINVLELHQSMINDINKRSGNFHRLLLPFLCMFKWRFSFSFCLTCDISYYIQMIKNHIWNTLPTNLWIIHSIAM
jgi:hypothetical protein